MASEKASSTGRTIGGTQSQVHIHAPGVKTINDFSLIVGPDDTFSQLKKRIASQHHISLSEIHLLSVPKQMTVLSMPRAYRDDEKVQAWVPAGGNIRLEIRGSGPNNSAAPPDSHRATQQALPTKGRSKKRLTTDSYTIKNQKATNAAYQKNRAYVAKTKGRVKGTITGCTADGENTKQYNEIRAEKKVSEDSEDSEDTEDTEDDDDDDSEVSKGS